MSHGDRLRCTAGLHHPATTDRIPVKRHGQRRKALVRRAVPPGDPHLQGQALLRRFGGRVRLPDLWTAANIIDDQIAACANRWAMTK